MYEREILELFKVIVVADKVEGKLNYDHIEHGFVTDFTPDSYQLRILKDVYKPLDIKTLFSVSERENSDPLILIGKQLLHYVEVYGLDRPGLFNLEVNGGKSVSLVFVRAVTIDELSAMVRKLLYTNAPVKDSGILHKIIDHYHIHFDINEVKNNELRVLLFDIRRDTYNNGDDAVRYLVYKATGSALLIKSLEVIEAMKRYPKDVMLVSFLKKHRLVLAQVFNRHKSLLMALKYQSNRTEINKISRLSKTEHIPIREAISKRFVAEAVVGKIKDYQSVLDKISIRDKFKILNLLEYKKEGHTQDAFVIRNGKLHIEPTRNRLPAATYGHLIMEVMLSLEKDLQFLKNKTILLDKNVHYGLPISRKQSLGGLPFGTSVVVNNSDISSGIYWENVGGARDLDLSTIDLNGQRTGWGTLRGYDRGNITFSGDITSAPSGAMEFMTSKVKEGMTYGLFVNIYCGEIGAKAKLVVGEKTDNEWIGNTIISEEFTLKSRGNVIGFVKDGKFVVYSCRLNSQRWSNNEKDKAVVSRGTANFWNINQLFDAFGIKYDIDKDPNKSYDHDLTYGSYTTDKLENIFFG